MKGVCSLAVTLGDPRGIGPEVVLKAAHDFLRERPEFELELFGAAPVHEVAASARLSLPPSARFVEVGTFDGSLASAGILSLEAIRRGVESIGLDRTEALVTGPVHKPALHAAGARVPGQTELLRDLTGVATVGMLMHARSTRLGERPLRILLATTHLALRDVPSRLTASCLDDQVRLLDTALRDRWRIRVPRIGLCGLNPHASDGGLFGDEERVVMAPVVETLRSEGVDVRGPLPADTIFLEALKGRLDAVVAPYHDVGMAVFKTLSFGGGVNTTLGLPFPRTSPDHGTAFDLAGTGRADPSSTLEALRLAAELADGSSDAVETGPAL